MKTIVSAVLAVAKGEIGTHESNDNSGVRVQQYQAATTLGGTHWPWCAAFVAWCLLQAFKKLGLPLFWMNSASCDVILAWARAQGLLRSSPQPGDVFLIRAKRRDGTYSTTDAIHTGIVESVNGGTFTEIAGNTNSSGGREGVAVLRQTRKITARFYFVRWADLVADAAEEKTPAPYSVLMLVSGQRVALSCRMENGSVLVAARQWADARLQKIEWDAENQAVIIGGVEVPFQARFYDGRAFFSLRDLCEMAGAGIAVDAAKRVVEVSG